jgi:predicted phage terminase large subunit-like protein
MPKYLTIEGLTNTALFRELCNRDFWEFCKYLDPKFFKESRPHLRLIAETLQAFYERRLMRADGKHYRKLMLNIPPRFGKSYTLMMFSAWIFGKNSAEKILTVSYNETLSMRFSAAVRDTIEQKSVDNSLNVFTDIFPDVSIKSGDSQKQLWSLTGTYFSYLGSSFKGTLTGFGGSIGIIDDPIKSADEANNERVKEEQLLWYKNTFLSRLEENSLQIVNMTRWATNDLCGAILTEQPNEWYVMQMEAKIETGEMLCPELLSEESYADKQRNTSPEIFLANFHQKPIDIEGRLYKHFTTYKEPPQGRISSYTDTADEGNCYLCSIVFVEYQKKAYVIDVLYTGAGMEVTERQTAEMFVRTQCNTALIESNNGGKGFARNVARIMTQDLKINRTVIKWFHQSHNKVARIITQSAWVMENIVMPDDWSKRWPEFHKDVCRITRDGKGQRVDAADALTGVAEMFNKKKLMMF